ncbi:hypothetical protein ACEPAI_7146 [Sanghuangporus weigelae]
MDDHYPVMRKTEMLRASNNDIIIAFLVLRRDILSSALRTCYVLSALDPGASSLSELSVLLGYGAAQRSHESEFYSLQLTVLKKSASGNALRRVVRILMPKARLGGL